MKTIIFTAIILLTAACNGKEYNYYIEKNHEEKQMPLSKYDKFITKTESGETVPSASVEIRDSLAALASIYSDSGGVNALPNPLTADANGRITFYVESGAYDVTATGGGETVVYNNESIISFGDVNAFYDSGNLVCEGVDIVEGGLNRKNILFDTSAGNYAEFQAINSSGSNAAGIASYNEVPAYDSIPQAYIRVQSDTDVGPEMTGFVLGSGSADVVNYRSSRATLDLYARNGYDLQLQGWDSKAYSGVKVSNTNNTVDSNETIFQIGDSTKFSNEGELTTFTGGLQLRGGTASGYVTARINGGISDFGGAYLKFNSTVQVSNPDIIEIGSENNNRIRIDSGGVEASSIATGTLSPIVTLEDLPSAGGSGVNFPAVDEWCFSSNFPEPLNNARTFSVGNNLSGRTFATQSLDDVPANATMADFVVNFTVTNSGTPTGAATFRLVAGFGIQNITYMQTVPDTGEYTVSFTGSAYLDANQEFELVVDEFSGSFSSTATIANGAANLKILRTYN